MWCKVLVFVAYCCRSVYFDIFLTKLIEVNSKFLTKSSFSNKIRRFSKIWNFYRTYFEKSPVANRTGSGRHLRDSFVVMIDIFVQDYSIGKITPRFHQLTVHFQPNQTSLRNFNKLRALDKHKVNSDIFSK